MFKCLIHWLLFTSKPFWWRNPLKTKAFRLSEIEMLDIVRAQVLVLGWVHPHPYIPAGKQKCEDLMINISKAWKLNTKWRHYSILFPFQNFPEPFPLLQQKWMLSPYTRTYAIKFWKALLLLYKVHQLHRWLLVLEKKKKQKTIAKIECILHARHWDEQFTCIIFFNLYSNLIEIMLS